MRPRITGKKRTCIDLWRWALVLLAIGLFNSSSTAQSADEIPAADRMLIASKIYHQVTTFFPDLDQKKFDQEYEAYLKTALSGSNDRKEFDLASMALVATLQ